MKFIFRQQFFWRSFFLFIIAERKNIKVGLTSDTLSGASAPDGRLRVNLMDQTYSERNRKKLSEFSKISNFDPIVFLLDFTYKYVWQFKAI
jgi:hypothetical protein